MAKKSHFCQYDEGDLYKSNFYTDLGPIDWIDVCNVISEYFTTKYGWNMQKVSKIAKNEQKSLIKVPILAILPSFEFG